MSHPKLRPSGIDPAIFKTLQDFHPYHEEIEAAALDKLLGRISNLHKAAGRKRPGENLDRENGAPHAAG